MHKPQHDGLFRSTRMTVRLALSAAELLLSVGWSLGCSSTPRITQLTVTPTEVCPNDPVDVSWSAEGEVVRLRQEPPMSLADPGRLSRDGVQGVAGDRDFDVVLEARGKNAPEVSRRRYVHVVTEAWTFVLTGTPVCRDGRVSVEVDFHVSDPQIDARLQVMTVVPRTDRAVRVSHRDLPAVIMPPGATTVFRGVPLAGLWTLVTALKKGEVCDGAGGKPPPTPALIVSGTCSGLPAVTQRGTLPQDSAPRCGHLGQPCCQDDRCESHYRCDTAQRICRDPERPSAITSGERCNRQPATVETRTFFVGIRDENRCGQVLSVLADSVEEANACARTTVTGTTTIVDAQVYQYDYCKNRRTQLFVTAFNDEDAASCARRRWPRARLAPGLCQQS